MFVNISQRLTVQEMMVLQCIIIIISHTTIPDTKCQSYQRHAKVNRPNPRQISASGCVVTSLQLLRFKMSIMRRAAYAAGTMIRGTGQALDRAGCRLQGNYAFKEHCMSPPPFVPYSSSSVSHPMRSPVLLAVFLTSRLSLVHFARPSEPSPTGHESGNQQTNHFC